MKVNLGGERVGSGSKMKQYLHNYERSTHNLSQRFTSTMGAGMLIPFMCELVTRDDKYEIDLSAGLRTIPTKGPLFGKFKLQLDVYQCPMRLYQALLHNNPTAIGLKANQVKFPKMLLYGAPTAEDLADSNRTYAKLMSATNSLVKYLGISGIGSCPNEHMQVERKMLAIPTLAYYDIFKNYYANKQEEKAYVINTKKEKAYEKLLIAQFYGPSEILPSPFYQPTYSISNNVITITSLGNPENLTLELQYNRTSTNYDNADNCKIRISYATAQDEFWYEGTLKELQEEGHIIWYNMQGNLIKIRIPGVANQKDATSITVYGMEYEEEIVALKDFELKNIDDMRMTILSFHQLGQSYILDGEDNVKQPYLSAIGDGDNHNWQKNLAGICVKTYQSDMYNCWLQTELIDGDNGISAITAIAVSDGKITIDALQFSEKLYNMLNRVAVAGNTYEDYLDAAYTESNKRFCESPMWVGGMADEITFEEIVQTAPSEGKPLGELGGRGNLVGKKKGGKITVKIDEPSFIIGIVSITPYVNYTQDNRFYNTEIDSLMDIHVPALDGIGFQNLIGERLHAASTVFDSNGEIQERPIIGKQPAWLEYMSAVDRAYGDFAEPEGKGYMVLNRDYLVENGNLMDATTYIDPSKYNYAFAYTELGAQNFWVSIYSNIKARRLMSAKQIPTT